MTQPPDVVEVLAQTIVRDVAELPDRTSPDDWPEAMLVTSEELHSIVRSALASAGYVVMRDEPWQPIETQPKEGDYLVFIPTERRSKIQVCSARISGNGKPIRVIGSLFDFDARPATLWRPMVKEPDEAALRPFKDSTP